jgi:hypothetical protein
MPIIETREKTLFLIKQEITIENKPNLHTLTLMDQQGNILNTYFAKEKNKLIAPRILSSLPKNYKEGEYTIILNFKITSALQNIAQELNMFLLESFDSSFLKDLEQKLENNLFVSKNNSNEFFITWYQNNSEIENFSFKNVNKFLRANVNIIQNQTCAESENNSLFETKNTVQVNNQNEETTTNLQTNVHLDISQQNNQIIPTTPVLSTFNTFQEIPGITKEHISLLITKAGINNSDKRNFKLEIARLRLLYIMTFFSPLNTTQILGMKKQDFLEHELAYLIINHNPELKRDFDYFFEKKVFISDSQKKNTHFINTRSYWVKVFNQDFYFFQEYYQTNTNFSLKDLKPFYYQLIADFSADSQVFQKITNCSPFLIRKYSGQINGSKSYETKVEKVYEDIIDFIGKIIM